MIHALIFGVIILKPFECFDLKQNQWLKLWNQLLSKMISSSALKIEWILANIDSKNVMMKISRLRCGKLHCSKLFAANHTNVNTQYAPDRRKHLPSRYKSGLQRLKWKLCLTKARTAQKFNKTACSLTSSWSMSRVNSAWPPTYLFRPSTSFSKNAMLLSLKYAALNDISSLLISNVFDGCVKESEIKTLYFNCKHNLADCIRVDSLIFFPAFHCSNANKSSIKCK